MTDNPLDALHLVIDACNVSGVVYAVIGGVARNAWAPARATTDIDLAVVVTRDSYQRLIASLAARGVVVARTLSVDDSTSIPDIIILNVACAAVKQVDLLVAKTPFEEEAVQQALERDVGVPCRVVRPEHLIVYKLIAARPRDWADAADILETCRLGGVAPDIDIVRKWARVWDVEDRLDRLLATQLP